MNVKQIISEWLASKGYDGLYCPDDPCGCLRDDLVPCFDFNYEDCLPGYRSDFNAEAECGCEGQGMPHWHVGAEKPAP